MNVLFPHKSITSRVKRGDGAEERAGSRCTELFTDWKQYCTLNPSEIHKYPSYHHYYYYSSIIVILRAYFHAMPQDWSGKKTPSCYFISNNRFCIPLFLRVPRWLLDYIVSPFLRLVTCALSPHLFPAGSYSSPVNWVIKYFYIHACTGGGQPYKYWNNRAIILLWRSSMWQRLRSAP